ncbi:response regulator transcription factor [Streptomyces sp. NPDC096030]|uniref:response regulator transcription factor n=1 Tax=Streptomyces sp. NPDC096030 TaxID=3155423 RepID=UPI00331EAA5E
MLIRAVVADDETSTRQALIRLLAPEVNIQVVGQAATGAEAVALTAGLHPDVLLLSITMPDMRGVEATRRIMRNPGAGARIVLLIPGGPDAFVYHALRAGASGFLRKDASAAQLARAVRIAAAGDELIEPGPTIRLLHRFAEAAQLPVTDHDRPLTRSESRVLLLIAQGFSNREIAAALNLTGQEVGTDVRRILAKLHLRTRAQAALYACESGIAPPGHEA